jgi:hypothetical protein
MLTNYDIVRKVKGAFLPMRCAVEVRDQLSQLRLMVLDHNGGVFKMPTVVLNNLRDERELERALRKVKANFKRQRCLLN